MKRPEPVTLAMSNDVVSIEQWGSVGVIRLNRPKSRNALHDDMYPPMLEAIRQFAADGGVGCLVVTGEGSAFSAGGDVRAGSGRPRGDTGTSFDDRISHLVSIAEVSVALHETPLVTIAAVNGPAAGAGMAIALACDIRVMTQSARFVPAWVKLGFSGDFGGAWLMNRLIGPSRTLEILATNRTITSEEALLIGLADHVTTDDSFLDTWWGLAHSLASGPRTAIGFIKENVNDALSMSLRDALVAEARRQIESGQTADHREAVRAWVEKREPRFGIDDRLR